MSETCTDTCSCDGQDDSKAGDVDEVVVQFLKELENASDAREVLLRYCKDHPRREREFRTLAGARRVLVMSEPVDRDPSTLIDRLGDFQIIREMARGGMGAIYEAVQEPFQRRVAVKTIRGVRRHLSDSARERFLREQDVLARLHHTHIVPIHAGGQHGDLEYFAMPYIEGAALHHVVRSARYHSTAKPSEETPSLAELAESASGGSPLSDAGDPSDETIPLETGNNGTPACDQAKPTFSAKYIRSVAKVMADAGDALHHAHQAGVIHRDLKPSNIMVDKHGHCWVLDFGLAAFQAARNGAAHASGAGGSTDGTTSGVMGTPRYMAPEQFQGRADERTDVWGLGITLYELLTLRPAFASSFKDAGSEPESPGKFVGNLPHDLKAIRRKALRKEPDHRYATAREFAEDLRRWLRGMPANASKPSVFRYVWLWSRRNPGWSTAAALALAMLLGASGGGMALEAFRASAAEAKTKLANARTEAARRETRERDRQLALLRIQQIRLTPKRTNWFRDLWIKVVEAKGPTFDAALQAQAAASLPGLDGRAVKSFEFGAEHLLYDPTGKRLLMGGVSTPDGLGSLPARIWNTTTQQLEVLKVTAKGPVAFQGMVPVELHVDEKSAPSVRNLESGDVLRSFEVPARYKLDEKTVAAIAADGALVGIVLVGPDDRSALVIWDGRTGKLRHNLPGRFDSLAFSPDRTLVAAGSESGQVTVWSLSDGREVARFADGWNPVHCLSWGRNPMEPLDDKVAAPDAGWLLAAGDAGGFVRVWDVKRKILRATCPGSAFDVYAVAFSPDGVTLASCGRDEIRLWDLWSNRLLLQISFASMETDLAFSPDGRSLAAASVRLFSKGEVSFFDLEEGHGARTLRGLIGQVMKAVYSPDKELVAALSIDWRVGIWERRTGRLLRLLDVPQGLVADNSGFAISPNNQRFAFSAGSEARLWNIRTGRLERSWKLNPGLGDWLSFLRPDEVLLARFETKMGDRMPGGGAVPWKFPRVVRCYRLSERGPITRVAEIVDFALDVRNDALSADGQLLVVSGIGCALDAKTGLPFVDERGKPIVDERTKLPLGAHRSINAFDPRSGTRLWAYSLPGDVKGPAQFLLDPTATRLYTAFSLKADSVICEILDAQTGARLSTFSAGDLGPEARLWTEGQEPIPTTVYEKGKTRPLVRLDPDEMRSSISNPFSRDGRLFTFGTREGTVLVFDLDEVQRQLASVGLGW